MFSAISSVVLNWDWKILNYIYSVAYLCILWLFLLKFYTDLICAIYDLFVQPIISMWKFTLSNIFVWCFACIPEKFSICKNQNVICVYISSCKCNWLCEWLNEYCYCFLMQFVYLFPSIVVDCYRKSTRHHR